MSQDQDRCPLCSRKLVMEAGYPTCLDCGYRNPYYKMLRRLSNQYSVQDGSHTNQYEVVIAVVVAVAAIVALAEPVAWIVAYGGATLLAVVLIHKEHKVLTIDSQAKSESERSTRSFCCGSYRINVNEGEEI